MFVFREIKISQKNEKKYSCSLHSLQSADSAPWGDRTRVRFPVGPTLKILAKIIEEKVMLPFALKPANG